MNDKELEEYLTKENMKAKPFRNYDDKYRVILTFDRKEDATKFIEAWNEEVPSRFRYIEEYK